MSTIDPKLMWRLLDRPQEFDFFQAVTLLERLRPERAPVGEFADPHDEVVRFETPSAVGFPASQILGLEDGKDDDPARMVVNFFGLTGPQGTLPLDYSLYASSRSRVGDYALKDFFGLFEHRIISLFYRAWVKTHAAASSGGSPTTDAASGSSSNDWLTKLLLAIVGLDTAGLQGRQPIDDESLLYYAGLIGMPSRSAVALEQLLTDYLDAPCAVEQFVGAWYPLALPAQTAVGDEAALLGGGAVAGDEVWDQQGRIRIRIGPLTRARYDEFLPGGAMHDAVGALTRFFGNDQFDFEIQLVLAQDEVPVVALGADDAPVPLGWCTWLRTAPLDRNPDDAIFTL